jgi:hypothetical protein
MNDIASVTSVVFATVYGWVIKIYREPVPCNEVATPTYLPISGIYARYTPERIENA